MSNMLYINEIWRRWQGIFARNQTPSVPGQINTPARGDMTSPSTKNA